MTAVCLRCRRVAPAKGLLVCGDCAVALVGRTKGPAVLLAAVVAVALAGAGGTGWSL